jgi:hypothetical protein
MFKKIKYKKKQKKTKVQRKNQEKNSILFFKKIKSD